MRKTITTHGGEEDFKFTGAMADLRPLFDDFSLVMRSTLADKQTDLWAIETEGNHLRRMKVTALDMEWGGEFIDNPCQSVHSIVLDLVLEGQCGRMCFLVDFNCYFRK